MSVVKGFFKGFGCMALYVLVMSIFVTIFPNNMYLPKLLSYSVLIPLCIFLYYKFFKKHAGESFLDTVRKCSVKSVVVSVSVWTICCYMFATIALFIANLYVDPNMEARNEYFYQESIVSPGLSLFCSCILAPIVEELVFRLLAYNVMKQSMFWPVAMFLSGLFFGVMHGTLSHCVFGTLFGCVLVLIYEHTGRNIFVPIVCHSIYNLIVSYSNQSVYPFDNTMTSVGYIILISVGIVIVSIKTNNMMKRHSVVAN